MGLARGHLNISIRTSVIFMFFSPLLSHPGASREDNRFGVDFDTMSFK